MEGIEKKVQRLKDYFEKRADVSMAFLFGSRASQRAHGGSDWDIAVYFLPASRGELEYEEIGRDYPEEDRLWGDLVQILETDNVDLLVLNRAPANVAESAIRGEPLIIKNRGLWLKFMLVTTQLAEDFREFARSYHEIYLRSASLTPPDAERLQRIIEFIENQMTLYRTFSGLSQVEYETNLVQRGAAERWVENMINAVADVSKIVLSSRKKSMPYGYADTVRLALLELNLPKELWDKFLGWIKLRNLLAHEYLDIKWRKIFAFVQESEPFFRRFVEAAKGFLEKSEQTNAGPS